MQSQCKEINGIALNNLKLLRFLNEKCQRIAILKLRPKTDNPRTVDEFRPISFLYTDLKILSDILFARRIKDLEGTVGQHQLAYLSKRQIHIALNKVRKVYKQLNNSKCLVNLDFSKAFDKLERDYIFALLEKWC